MFREVELYDMHIVALMETKKNGQGNDIWWSCKTAESLEWGVSCY